MRNTLFSVLFAISLALPALAQEEKPAAPPPAEQSVTPPPADAPQTPPALPTKSWTRVEGNPDMSEFVSQVDADHDGKMTRAEWIAAGLPLGPFNGMADGRDFVTEEDYDTTPAPPGIDLDGNDKLSITEFIWFDQKVREDNSAAKKDAPKPQAPGR